MKRSYSCLLLALTATLGLSLVGCGGEAKKTDKPKTEEHGHDHGAGEHAEHGPHEGQLIELGKEEYHAELVHDDKTHTITIYLLDGKAKEAVTSDAAELTINLVVDGKPEQFALPATPQDGEAAGKVSRFQLVSEPLCKALDSKEVKGRLNVKLGDQTFAGDLAPHAHEH